MPKSRRKKNNQGQGGGQAFDSRQPEGQPNAGGGLVKQSGKKKNKGKSGAAGGRGAGRGQSGGCVKGGRARRGGQVFEQAVETVKEDGLFRHHDLVKAHSDAVMSIVMAEDCIYTASRDKLLKRWKPQRSAANRFELKPDIEVPLGEVAWCLHNAGEWIFCGLGNGRIRAYSKAGRELNLEGHTKRVSCLLTHQHVLLSGGADGTVRCWQMNPESQTFACTHTIGEGISGNVNCLAVLSECLWVGGTSGVSIIELATLKVVAQLQPKKFVAGLLHFQGHMITAYSDGAICIFDAAGKQTHSQPALPAGPILCLAGLESGPRLLCGHNKGQVSSITLPMMQLKKCYQTFDRCKVVSMCTAGHDGIFLVGAESGTIQLWQRDEAAAEP